MTEVCFHSYTLTWLFLFLLVILQEAGVHPETLVGPEARLQRHQLDNTKTNNIRGRFPITVLSFILRLFIWILKLIKLFLKKSSYFSSAITGQSSVLILIICPPGKTMCPMENTVNLHRNLTFCPARPSNWGLMSNMPPPSSSSPSSSLSLPPNSWGPDGFRRTWTHKHTQ